MNQTQPSGDHLSGTPHTQAASVAAFSPLSLLKAIWDHKLLAAALWISLTALSAYIVYRLAAVYRAEAEILVESQRIPERYVSATVAPDLQDRLSGLREQVLSGSRLTEIIDQYGLYKEDRKRLAREDLLARIRADIAIKPTRSGPSGPSAFMISYQANNPQVAAQVANRIATFFIEENVRQRATEAEGASEFLEHQLSEAKKRLEDQEAMLSEYKLAHSGELPQQENALLASVSQVKVQLAGVQDALNRAQQNKLMLETSLADAEMDAANAPRSASRFPAAAEEPETGPPAPRKQSDRLAAELAALTVRYSPEHPEVRRVKAELQRALVEEAAAPSAPAPAAKPRKTEAGQPESTVGRQRVETLKTQIATVTREIDGLNEERRNLQANISGLEGHIARLPLREQQLASVTRDYETTKAAYQSLLDKKLAADVAADMEKRQKSERFVPIEMARVPEKPIKPKRQILAGGASLFALILSMALAAAIEFRKGVLMGEWELPHGTTVLGRIPVMTPQPVAIWHARFRSRGPVALSILALLAAMEGLLIL